jgi:Succinyl-CoA synthetase, beta subunit
LGFFCGGFVCFGVGWLAFAFFLFVGRFGCLVLGAGFALALLGFFRLFGGVPALFFVVGGGASLGRVSAAFQLFFSAPDVPGIFLFLFGGLLRCVVLALGVVDAAVALSLCVPFVVSLAGPLFRVGGSFFVDSGLLLFSADRFDGAAACIVEALEWGVCFGLWVYESYLSGFFRSPWCFSFGTSPSVWSNFSWWGCAN